MTKGKKPANLVQTITRTTLILETIGNYPSGLSLGELSEIIELPKGTTHRLLTSLAYFDFIRQDKASKHYHLGFKLVELGNHLLSHIDVRKEAHPYLIRLGDDVQETVHLVVLDQNKAIYIDKVDFNPKRGGLQMVSSLGSRIPLHCSAVGKVLMADMPETDVDMILQNVNSDRRTRNTITDPFEMKQHLQMIRTTGYAMDDEENEEGVRCVAAPIRNEIGKVVAAMSVSGPTTRMTIEKIDESLKFLVTETAMRISRKLGFSMGTDPYR
ncbi:MAG: IclR family transcriptional regulator [Desulfobacterales bacterium]|nr:IclR family transcriptional regulator [Desulfobacterales bacterium]